MNWERLKMMPLFWFAVAVVGVLAVRLVAPGLWSGWMTGAWEWLRIGTAAVVFGWPLLMIGPVEPHNRKKAALWSLTAVPVMALSLWGSRALPGWWLSGQDKNTRVGAAWLVALVLMYLGGMMALRLHPRAVPGAAGFHGAQKKPGPDDIVIHGE